MSNSTNPWLGGDTNGNWSNHYELLGIPVGFADEASIQRIANLLLQRLQTATHDAADIDRRSKAIQQARDCLTNLALRTEYNQTLGLPQETIASTESKPPSTTIDSLTSATATDDIPTAIPIAEPIFEPTTNTPDTPQFETRKSTRTNIRRQRSSRSWLTIATLVCGVLLFAALAWLGKRLLVDQTPTVVAKNPSEVQSPSNTDTPVESPAKSPVEPDSTDNDTEETLRSTPKPPTTTAPPNEIRNREKLPKQESTPIIGNAEDPMSSQPAPAQPEPSLENVEQEIAPLSEKEIELLSKALIAIPESLSDKRFARANKALSIAQETATHPEHGRLVSASADLVHYAQEYWAAFDDAWNDLSAGRELVVGSTRVNVVEVTNERITLRVAGTNKRYQRDSLPAGLQQAIIGSWLNPDAVSSKLILGAYWAIRSANNGTAEVVAADREKARELWQDAKALGGPADLLLSTLTPTYQVRELRQLEATNP